jgi:uncharacterized membrane protein YeaQ/YmgE (transglycosylase-associated protein family)
MHILGTIVIGIMVGLVARFTRDRDDRTGVLLITLLSIIGAFVGRYIGEAVGFYSTNQPAGFVGAIVGAVLMIALIHSSNYSRRLPH